MTTYNTGNPLGSSAAKDLYDNAQNFDYLSNDQSNETCPDRFGKTRLTWHGMEKRYQEKLSSMGWTMMDSFQDGADLTRADQALRWKLPDGDGEYYRWDGLLPKLVPPGSTPASTGGIGPGAWLSVGDATLRGDLISDNPIKGSDIVTYTPKFNDGVSMSVSDKFAVDLVTLSDYGFKVGNTGAQNKAAFQKAIDDASGATKFIIPAGGFNVDPGITIKDKLVKIEGQGPYQSSLFSAKAGSPFITQQSGEIAFLELSDFSINGNGLTEGVLLPESNHTKIDNIIVTNTIGYAIDLGGYSNDITGCRVFSNFGDSIKITGIANNVNVQRNKFYANNGVAVTITPSSPLAGLSINVNYNNMEGNKKAAIVAVNCKSLNLDSNYYEANCELGITYQAPEVVLVRSDIHLLSNLNTQTLVLDLPYINQCVSVKNSHVTPIGFTIPTIQNNSFVFTNFASNLSIEKTQILDTSKVNDLLALYKSNKYSQVNSPLHIGSNSKNTVNYLGNMSNGNIENPSTSHFIDIDGASFNRNFADRNLLEW
ncbi:right-handed parallel beta-helix repeat-containing protein [Escherichia sp. E4694]|uniref:tail fiber/spike domain-containing protein n=1 Tax=Escherichia sp. E4694 TaxID=2044464 RepID=UPI001080D44B|nr:right-handed parallel beta-helix repeat-containing protein [Escherichia sp. E4694]